MNIKEKIKEHKLVTKNILFTVLPAVVFPAIDIIQIFNSESKIVLVIIAIIFIANQVIKYSLKEEAKDV